jgi:hypothetical protein
MFVKVSHLTLIQARISLLNPLYLQQNNPNSNFVLEHIKNNSAMFH